MFYTPDAVARGWPAEELRLATREGRFEDEGWRLRKDGSRFWANVVITALYDRTGTLLERAARHSDKHEPAKRGADDLAAILYTSGTTGRSKGAMLSHGNLLSNAQVLKDYWGWQSGDVLLHALPIFHVHGLFVALHGALLNGSKMIWFSKFDPLATKAAEYRPL